MKTLSLDLRERILTAYDAEQGTRDEIAKRFRVSMAMVKKLLAQRRKIGDIGPLHHRAGRKPLLDEKERNELSALVHKKPDITLAEMKESLGLGCTLQAIHYVLIKMGLTYKKRLSMRVSRAERT